MRVLDHASAGRFRRLMRRLGWTRPMSWLNARTMHHADRAVYRATRRRTTFAEALVGLPVVMLETTGARSGLTRTVPVIGVPHGDDVAVIASNYGQAQHPAWYYNLRADPHARVVVAGDVREVVAEEVGGAERDRVWRRGLLIYPGWREYERWAGDRDIGVFVLRRRG